MITCTSAGVIPEHRTGTKPWSLPSMVQKGMGRLFNVCSRMNKNLWNIETKDYVVDDIEKYIMEWLL